MTYSKGILTIVGLLFCFAVVGQNDTIIKKGFVNFAALIVDYETYEFEGGNLSYYKCTDCDNQSIPFLIDYDSPGDFGGVTFLLEPTMDTIFDATIIWSGLGQIYYPTNYESTSPFSYIETTITEPADIQYINTDGKEMDDSYLLTQAQLVWDSVDSLEITNLFSEKGLKAAIYFYPPSVGAVDPTVAKWIVFLYYSDKTSTMELSEAEIKSFCIFPNPAENTLRIIQQNTSVDLATYRLYNSDGKTAMEGIFTDSDYQIEVSALPTGLYYVQLIDSRGEVVGVEEIIRK